MHARIIQISPEPLNKDEYINESDCYDYLERIGADYVSDMECPKEEADGEAVELVDKMLPKGLFTVDKKNRTITVKKENERDWSEANAWWEDFKKRVNETSAQDALRDKEGKRYRMKKVLTDFGGADDILYIDGTVFHLTDAIETLLYGDVWYIGGEIDYHF